MRAFTIGSRGFVLPLTGVEALKWFGFVAMIQEHVLWYVFDFKPFTVWAVGRLAFPLFAFALAQSASRDADAFLRLIVRLVLWGAAAEAFRALVVPADAAYNILFTFALGLVVARSVEHGLTGLVVACVCLALSSFVEYGMFGVLFVALMRLYFAGLNFWMLALAAVCLCAANTHWIPLAAFVVSPVVAVHVSIARAPGIFYYAYAAHWLALWGLRHVF